MLHLDAPLELDIILQNSEQLIMAEKSVLANISKTIFATSDSCDQTTSFGFVIFKMCCKIQNEFQDTFCDFLYIVEWEYQYDNVIQQNQLFFFVASPKLKQQN